MARWVGGWLVISACTYDPHLGKMVDLAYMIARRWNGVRYIDSANTAMYKRFFDSLFSIIREYLARPNLKVHFKLVVADQAPEIANGQRDSWVAHDPLYYKTDHSGALVG